MVLNLILGFLCAFVSGMAGGVLFCNWLGERSLRNPVKFELEGDFIRTMIETNLRRLDVDQAYILLIKEKAFRTIAWASRRNPKYYEQIKAFENSVFDGLEKGSVINPCIYGSRAFVIEETNEDEKARS